MKPDYNTWRDERDMILVAQHIPTLRKVGIGWLCMGRGLKMHAMTPKTAYDCWEFATMKGYHYLHEQERRDWLVRGSTGLARG